jgi:hypothetical protein
VRPVCRSYTDNLFDRILVGAGCCVNISVGLVVAILHKITQELDDFAVLIHAGFN